MKRITLILTALLCCVGLSALTRVEKNQEGFKWIKVDDNGKIGAESVNGHLLIPAQFDGIYFHEGEFHVAKGDYHGIYDAQGREIISPDRGYTLVGRVEDAGIVYYVVWKGEYRGACDALGKEVMRPLYRSIVYYKGEFYTQDSGEWMSIKRIDLSNATATAASRKNTPASNKTTANASGSSKTTASAKMSYGQLYELWHEGYEYYQARNYTKAVDLWRKAAEQGFAMAQATLGDCYYEGNGVGQNYVEAAKWYRKSAEQGAAYGQHKLGRCYVHGKGVSQNYVEAVKWYRNAAEQGLVDAQIDLGLLYYAGVGVTKNLEEAKKWLIKAAAQGNEEAKTMLMTL